MYQKQWIIYIIIIVVVKKTTGHLCMKYSYNINQSTTMLYMVMLFIYLLIVRAFFSLH